MFLAFPGAFAVEMNMSNSQWAFMDDELKKTANFERQLFWLLQETNRREREPGLIEKCWFYMWQYSMFDFLQ